MKKNIFNIVFVLILLAGLVGCQGKNNDATKVSGSDPIYEVRIPQNVSGDTIIDEFYSTANSFFKASYPDAIYTGFVYFGNLPQIDSMDGNMSLSFASTESGIMGSVVTLTAVYDAETRIVSYYTTDSGKKPDEAPQSISTARFIELTGKVKGYLQNIKVTDGIVQITEETQDGIWTVLHYSSANSKADLELRIDTVTLDLIEYKQNP
jgi:hypothetical protein